MADPAPSPFHFDCGAEPDQVLVEGDNRVWPIDRDLAPLVEKSEKRLLSQAPALQTVAWLTDVTAPAPAYVFSPSGDYLGAQGTPGIDGVGVALLHPLCLDTIRLFTPNDREAAMGCCFPRPWAVMGMQGQRATFTRVHLRKRPPRLPHDLQVEYPTPTRDPGVLRPLGALVEGLCVARILWGSERGRPLVWERLESIGLLAEQRHWEMGRGLVRASGSLCTTGLFPHDIEVLTRVAGTQLADSVRGL
jgi:hypothetical protein